MKEERTVLSTIVMVATETPTLPPATHTNSYAIGSRQVLLIEPASPYESEQRAWIDWARNLRTQGRELLAIVLTHHHLDHIGGVYTFARELNLPIWAHQETLDRLSLEKISQLKLQVHALHDGEKIVLDGPFATSWRVLHTPGHAPGHICLFSAPLKTLIAGDMVANGSFIVVPPDDGGDMQAYISQLERLSALEASLMLPAHGEPIDDPKSLLQHYIHHRKDRENKIIVAYEQFRKRAGRAPVSTELLSEVYADTPTWMWPIAKASLDAHWIKLEREGRLGFHLDDV